MENLEATKATALDIEARVAQATRTQAEIGTLGCPGAGVLGCRKQAASMHNPHTNALICLHSHTCTRHDKPKPSHAASIPCPSNLTFTSAQHVLLLTIAPPCSETLP